MSPICLRGSNRSTPRDAAVARLVSGGARHSAVLHPASESRCHPEPLGPAQFGLRLQDDQARLLAGMKLQLDRIEDTTGTIQGDVAASAEAASKKIDPNAYYSYPEACEAVGVSKSTLHRQVANGKLRTVRIGKLVRFVMWEMSVQLGNTGEELAEHRVPI